MSQNISEPAPNTGQSNSTAGKFRIGMTIGLAGASLAVGMLLGAAGTAGVIAVNSTGAGQYSLEQSGRSDFAGPDGTGRTFGNGQFEGGNQMQPPAGKNLPNQDTPDGMRPNMGGQNGGGDYFQLEQGTKQGSNSRSGAS